jgi:hypothetical protein
MFKRSASGASEINETNNTGKASVLSTDRYNNHYLTMRAVNMKKMKRTGSCQSNNSSNPQTEQESNQPCDPFECKNHALESSDKYCEPTSSILDKNEDSRTLNKIQKKVPTNLGVNL